VLTYNIKHGRGNDGRVDLARAAALIERLKPDLVALQEIDRGAARSGHVDQMAALAAATGMYARFSAFMPYDGGEYGMGILSRLPILATHDQRLPDGAEPRTALSVRVALADDRELEFCNVHLYATAEERLAQAQAVMAERGDAELSILAGDFNSEPGSEVMQQVTRVWSNVEKPADRMTFSSTAPTREIDFVLVRPRERFQVLSMEVLDEPLVSDHRPVLAVLRVVAHHGTAR